MPPRRRPPTVESVRSEEHTSELQSRGLISYAVFCLKKKKTKPATPPQLPGGTSQSRSPRLSVRQHLSCRSTYTLGCTTDAVEASFLYFFFFNDPAPPEISPLSLPALLPISAATAHCHRPAAAIASIFRRPVRRFSRDRKSTRLNSSHVALSRMPSPA